MYSTGEDFMQEFHIEMDSFRQVQEFVRLAAQQPFEIRVGNDHQRINGKDLMGMFSLDYSRPVCVHAECEANLFADFYNSVKQMIN